MNQHGHGWGPQYPQQPGYPPQQHYGYPQQQHHQPAPPPPPQSDNMFKVGLALVVVGCTIGAVLNVTVFVLPAIASPQFGDYMALMLKSAVIAYLPVAIYLSVPYVVDRYDPEPWWALAGVFCWGAMFATGVSAVLNTVVGSIPDDPAVGSFLSSTFAAPIFEEATKGLAILGMVIFLRKEFDGVVDGIIYGTFAGIGFAATENVIYYMRYHESLGAGGLNNIFVMRGMLTPWLHPFFTAMTGIGFGLAREKGTDTAKVVYPVLGYFVAVFLHAWWNGMPQVAGFIHPSFGALMTILNLIFGVIMALGFLGLICYLVYRKGQTIKKFLEDEVLIGTISQEEFALITSYLGRVQARFSWRGKAGADFVAAGARLALSKWHTARAMQGSKRTISADFIVPLRQDIARLRQLMMANARQ